MPTVEPDPVLPQQSNNNEPAPTAGNKQPTKVEPLISPPEPTFVTPQQSLTPSQTITPSTPNTTVGVTGTPSMLNQQTPPPNKPTMGSMGQSGSSPSKPKGKKIPLLAGAAALFLILIGGFIFAYYLPNRPSNVYSTGLNRSAKALEKVVNAATEKSKLETYKKSEINLAVDAQQNGMTAKGTFNIKFDTSKAEGNLDFTTKKTGIPDVKYGAKFIADVPAGSQYPDMYLQLSGIKTMGIDMFIPGASAYDGKWISIMADYFKTLGVIPTVEETNKKTLTTDDISELARTASGVTAEYVFSADPKKAVFDKKSNLGKEKVDGMNTFRYRVGINKEHLKAYCKALTNKVYSTNAYKKLSWVDENNVDKDKESASKNCDSTFDKIKTDTTYDLWVETKNKLIYKIRIPDSSNKENYVDVGQVYKGGDDISLFVAHHNEKEKIDGKFTLEINIKTSVTKGTYTMTGDGLSGKEDVKVTLEAKPFTGEINTSKPAGAIPIQDVLKQLGLDSYFGLGGTSGAATPAGGTIAIKSANTERQTDIKAMHGQIEAFYAQNGFYPGLADINNSAWRSVSMKGLDGEALKDPKGTAQTLCATASATCYGYAVFQSDGKTACTLAAKNCAVYTLTANLEGGGTYTKSNLN